MRSPALPLPGRRARLPHTLQSWHCATPVRVSDMDYVTTCEHEYPITQTDGAGIPYMGCMDCDWRDYDADDLESARVIVIPVGWGE